MDTIERRGSEVNFHAIKWFIFMNTFYFNDATVLKANNHFNLHYLLENNSLKHRVDESSGSVFEIQFQNEKLFWQKPQKVQNLDSKKGQTLRDQLCGVFWKDCWKEKSVLRRWTGLLFNKCWNISRRIIFRKSLTFRHRTRRNKYELKLTPINVKKVI